MKHSHLIALKNGMRDAVPVFLGYIAVSFTFGIQAISLGFTLIECVLISASNLTSAGQFAGITLIHAGASAMEIAVASLVINSRYFLMSSAIVQNIPQETPLWKRMTTAYGMTDEIFALGIAQGKPLDTYYMLGATIMGASGWTLGTLLGSLSGSILDQNIIDALSVALYGMLIAIIIPKGVEDRIVGKVILISMLSSALFQWMPLLNKLGSGFHIIFLTVVIAAMAALIHPIEAEA